MIILLGQFSYLRFFVDTYERYARERLSPDTRVHFNTKTDTKYCFFSCIQHGIRAVENYQHRSQSQWQTVTQIPHPWFLPPVQFYVIQRYFFNTHQV